MSEYHLTVMQLVSQATARYGFAIGGGYALVVHGITQRPTKDIDAYVNSFDTDIFQQAEHSLRDALVLHGFEVQTTRSMDWFRGFDVTHPTTGEVVSVDLAQDYRAHTPRPTDQGIIVLDLHDVVVGKLGAFMDRAAPRDYSDIDSLITAGWSVHGLQLIAAELRPDLPPTTFTVRLSQAAQLPPGDFTAAGLDHAGITRRLVHAAQAATQPSLNQRIQRLRESTTPAIRPDLGADRTASPPDFLRGP